MLYGWWKSESIEDYSQEILEDVDEPENLLDDGFDPVEGCTLKIVGWMKVALRDAGLEGIKSWVTGDRVISLVWLELVWLEETFAALAGTLIEATMLQLKCTCFIIHHDVFLRSI
ncbi:hypothetical protein N7486_006058 [Penicillium sp. IBT 16267x]|nr:hypothetical protein N7486_006058 [Penicillium sp. IBT 16267x]